MPTFDKVGTFADNQPYPLLVALQFIFNKSAVAADSCPKWEKSIKKESSDGLGLGVCPLRLSLSLCFYVATQRHKCGECCRAAQVIMKQKTVTDAGSSFCQQEEGASSPHG